MDKKRIYVSDVHMGAAKRLVCDHDYNWLGPAAAENFAGFLDYLNTQDDIGEIVLLGDTLDNWVCPIDRVPPTFDEILAHNQTIVCSLNALAGKKKVVCMPGNHDMQVSEEVLKRHVPQLIYGGSAYNKSRYRTGRLLAEHGSSYAMFNAPDPINDPRSRLPLGYFISRVVATKAARTGAAKRHFWTFIDDLLELLGPQKLPQAVFEAILEEANIRDDAKIILGTEDQTPEGTPITITVQAVRERYADLYEQWESHYGKGLAFKAVMAEIGYLGDFADYLSKKGDTNIIIFGHSHDSQLDKDSWFVDDRIYANCGAWCDEKKPCSFIETQKDETGREYHVRLMKWEKNSVKVIKQECVEI